MTEIRPVRNKKVVDGTEAWYCKRCDKWKEPSEWSTVACAIGRRRAAYCKACNASLTRNKNKRHSKEGRDWKARVLWQNRRGLRPCSKCDRDLPLSAFNYHPTGQFKLGGVCKECKKLYRESRADIMRGQRLRRRYGVTLKDYNSLLEKQGGACAICGKDADRAKGGVLDVDHDHRTGVVRGLLCNQCNKGIGVLQDDVDVLRSAIEYLTRIKEMP